ncbi:MAG TPA: hypothetical protein VF294_10135 [Polyangiaceae bacterium]
MTELVSLGTLVVDMANLHALTWGRKLGQTALLGVAALTVACALSCSSSSVPSPGATASAGASASAGTSAGGAADGGPSGQGSVTFHRDLEPILQKSCQSCHVAGGIAPFPLLTYKDAFPVAEDMAGETAAKIMPPWHAENTDECTVPLGWKNDIRLSDAEIALFKAWVDAGRPEGDPADAPPPRAPTPGLPGVQQELKPPAAFSVAPGADQFRCFVMDPKLLKDSYVNGMFVIPGNSAVVHHVLVFSDPTAASAAKADESGSYDCFGSVGVPNSELLMAWTPGGVPLEYPSNVAAVVGKGSLIVMQVHYHPHSATDMTTDQTRVQLRFIDTAPEWQAITKLIGNFPGQAASGDGLLPGPDDPASGPKFIIPANAKAHTETMQYTYRGLKAGGVPPKLYGVGGHMHYVGVDEKITVQRADNTEACLMQIPHWDFDWQRRYDYDASIENLPELATGDKLIIRCTYNNTMDNLAVAASLNQQGLTAPHDVVLGETTLDEMCLANVTALYPAAAATAN